VARDRSRNRGAGACDMQRHAGWPRADKRRASAGLPHHAARPRLLYRASPLASETRLDQGVHRVGPVCGRGLTIKENNMPGFPTSTTVLDSILFRDAFGTPEMREVFSDLALISRYAEVEIALARAESRCGVIPAEAADEIARRTDVAAL